MKVNICPANDHLNSLFYIIAFYQIAYGFKIKYTEKAVRPLESAA